MSSDNSQIFIDVTYKVTGKYHKSGYCSDPSEIFEIDVHTTNIRKDPPSKEFIEKNFDNEGKLDEDYDISILDFSSNCIHGSGHCGCSKNYTAVDAKLIIVDTSIKSQFLAKMTNDSGKKVSTALSINYKISPSAKKSFYTSRQYNTKISFNGTKKTPVTSHFYAAESNKTTFMSPSYKARCSTIKCKYGDKCRYKDNTYGRICYFKH